MKEQIPQPAPESRILQGKTREANTASVNYVLQAYKNGIYQRQEVDEDELLQGKFETAQRDELEDDELLQGKFETAQRKEVSNNIGLPVTLKPGLEQFAAKNRSVANLVDNHPTATQLKQQKSAFRQIQIKTNPTQLKNEKMAIGRTEPDGNTMFSGHSGLLITGEHDDKKWSHFAEFMPAVEGNAPEELFKGVPGTVNTRNEHTGAMEEFRKYEYNVHDIDEVKKSTAQAEIQKDVSVPPYYSFRSFNCSHWVKKIANGIGISAPAVENRMPFEEKETWARKHMTHLPKDIMNKNLVKGDQYTRPPEGNPMRDAVRGAVQQPTDPQTGREYVGDEYNTFRKAKQQEGLAGLEAERKSFGILREKHLKEGGQLHPKYEKIEISERLRQKTKEYIRQNYPEYIRQRIDDGYKEPEI